MPKITSLRGVLTLPEVKLNFVLYLDDETKNEFDPAADAHDPAAISRIVRKAAGLSQEMQEIVAAFADYLAKQKE